MGTATESQTLFRAIFWFVFVLFLVLMAVAHVAAELQALSDANSTLPVRVVHSTVYYRVVFAIWVTILFLIPALCFHVFSRSDAPNSYWRILWTFSFLAFATHLYWSVFGMFHGDLAATFHSREGEATDAERVVDHPGPDF
jgi:hypothetical protein